MAAYLTTKMKHWISITSLMALIVICGGQEPVSVSQISPKSEILEGPGNDNFRTLSTLSTSADHITLNLEKDTPSQHAERIDESKIRTRIERSAMPIINELSSRPSLEVDHLNDFESNDVDVSGRYFNYIKPTATLDQGDGHGEITKSQRMGKDLSEKSENSFLSKGGPRPITSGSPINPTTASQMISPAATSINPNHPRQKPNPDIQDIITGIVKLLNGNVNVHANTQVLRRPVASRINNRGPPRISEAQPIPMDYDGKKVLESTLRPPPFSFERPEGPLRPFITGVPLPEQLVPTMQQNYRPSFVSQNRPPWHRPRPRPPIGGRRPVPPYKPIPPLLDYHPEDEIQFTTLEAENNETLDLDNTDTTSDAELDNDGDDKVYLFSSTDSSEATPTTMEIPVKKDDHIKKKDTKIKSSEKKPVVPIVQTERFEPSMTTIFRSTSVVNTAQVIAPKITESFEIIELEPSSTLESSIEEFTPTTSSPTTSTSSSTETPTLIEVELSSSPITSTPSIESTTTTTIALIEPTTTETTTISTSSAEVSHTREIVTEPPPPSTSTLPYHPRPGIVLDDPEFKPGGGAHRPNQRPQRPVVQPTRHTPPPGYGEIFDVTLSAIQGPGTDGGSQQTINIKPFGSQYGGTGNGDIIISPSGEEGFVSIDGKRTYINLFGESTEAPTPSSTLESPSTPASKLPLSPGITGTGYAVPEVDPIPQPTKNPKPHITPTQLPSQRPHYRPRTTQPPVRIDTCIVGDDSTCDQAQNEKCKTENGVSSCHCRPSYSRRKHREPCRRVVSFFMGLRVDRIYERRIVWDKLLLDQSSELYGHLSYESVRAIDSAMSMTPFSDEFMDAKVNNIYHGDPTQGTAGVFVNLTLKLEENAETLRPNLRGDVQKHLLGVIHRRNNNIGNSVLYVESPPGSISNLQDLDECESEELNDCHSNAVCMNVWGSFRCQCETGYRDPWSDQPQRSGRDCQSCPETYCNNRGVCNYDTDGTQVCSCDGNYYGSQCEIDGEVLGVAIGASVAAVIIIVLTLICLIMWSRRWHREQKNAMGSPVFGYMASAPVKTSSMGQTPYQVTLEDRMRWAQIADVMAQANHYAAEPVASTRPSSAMFGYPNLQAMNMGALGGMSMAGTLPIHQGPMPPIPLPRLGLNSRSNGMRTLDNSSSSEEEDRTDLLGRNFQVPRPKSRSNGSIANQSGIYYDVEYEPSGGEMYGTTTTSISNQIPGPQGIPMSTYTSGRAPSMYYMKQ